MLADELDYVVGVDPHRDAHALGVVEVRSGVVVFETTVAADSGGYAEALRLAEQHAPGRRAFAVEGTGSYGAGLTRFLTEPRRAGVRGRPTATGAPLGRQDGRARRGPGRAQRARQKRPATPRSSGEREALRALMAAREGAVNAKRAGPLSAARPARHDTRAASQRAAAAHTRAAAQPARRDPARTPPRPRAARQHCSRCARSPAAYSS